MLKKIVHRIMAIALLFGAFGWASTHRANATPDIIDALSAWYDSCSGSLTITSTHHVEGISADATGTILDANFNILARIDFADVSFSNGVYTIRWQVVSSPITLHPGQTIRVKILDTDYGSPEGPVFTSIVQGVTNSENCLGSIRGTAYQDGGRFTGAWYKITDGGNWFVCGTVGDDATFGVPVKAGAYFIVPLDLPGLRATSGITRVVVSAGAASLGYDIKYVADPSARHESCDLYNPPRPIPSSVR